MDFITHTLIGVGCARLLALRRPELLPQVTVTAILGSTLMDADGIAGLILGQDFYGRWHRVATHSIIGLAACAAVAAAVGWRLGAVERWRRFGWHLADRLAADSPLPERAPAALHLRVACVAAAMHFVADAITGYGNLHPFWPWSTRFEASLHATNSFDAVMLGMALAWHFAARWRPWPAARQVALGAAWLGLSAAYVGLRLLFLEPAVW